jgi:uncharacterized protein YegP (UPF0339 family)
MREGVGHSFSLADAGTLFVSVPFVSVTELADVRIRLTDLSGVTLPKRNLASLTRLFDQPMPGMRAIRELDTASLQAAADWPDVARQLGIATHAGRFEIYIDEAGQYRWRLLRISGEIVADSGQGYRTRQECEADLAWLRMHAGDAPVTSLDIPPSEGPTEL